VSRSLLDDSVFKAQFDVSKEGKNFPVYIIMIIRDGFNGFDTLNDQQKAWSIAGVFAHFIKLESQSMPKHYSEGLRVIALQ
jgi:hypothetical protein